MKEYIHATLNFHTRTHTNTNLWSWGVWKGTCMHASLYLHLCAWVCAQVCVCVYVYVCVCVCVCVCEGRSIGVHRCVKLVRVGICVCMGLCIYVCLPMCVTERACVWEQAHHCSHECTACTHDVCMCVRCVCARVRTHARTRVCSLCECEDYFYYYL